MPKSPDVPSSTYGRYATISDWLLGKLPLENRLSCRFTGTEFSTL